MSNFQKDLVFIEILSRVIVTLDEIMYILKEVQNTEKIYNTKKLEIIFEELFLSELLTNHIEYKITLIGKSSHFNYWGERNEENSNKHIKLSLVSEEIKYYDNLYENKFSDLLKFFKYVFSIIENFFINDNSKKVIKYQKLLSIIKEDFVYLKSLQIKADQYTNQKNDILKAFLFLSTDKKEDWQLFLKIIIENNIESLYHFTDKSNLDSIIKNNGLYSWFYCEINNLKIPLPSGNQFSRELDKQKNLHNYVRLSFCENHPMKFIALKESRIKNPIILKCDTELLLHKNVLYSDRNANKKESIINHTFEHFKSLKFDIFKKRYFDINENRDLASFYQAEILIPQHIPIKYITNLHNL